MPMSSSLVVRDNWLIRALAWVRAIRPVLDEEHKAGLDFGGDYPAQPTMSPIDSMSAMAAFPYVFACIRVISSDMASLPLIATRTNAAGEEEQVADHPMIELLNRPNSQTNSVLFRRQMWADYLLAGNVYLRKLRDRGGQGEVVSLVRMHPNRVTVHSNDAGMIEGYRYDDHTTGYDLRVEDVLHVRAISWEDSPSMLYGTGAVLPLRDDLTADQSIQNANRKNFDAGRPTIVASPTDTNVRLDAEETERASQKLNQKLSANRGGAVVMGGAFDITDLGWTPKDMEGIEQRDWGRRAVMAVLHVPPVKLGLETANYATAKEQILDYWTTQIKEAALFDAEFSLQSEDMGRPGTVIRHHTASVPALQHDRSERLRRVGDWVVLGMDANQAARYEGFEDAPDLQAFDLTLGLPTEADAGAAVDKAQDTALSPASPPDAEKDDPERAPDERSGLTVLSGQADEPPESVTSWWARTLPTETEGQRERVWRAFEDDLRGPTERQMAIIVSRFFRMQSNRIAKRAEKEIGSQQRSISDTIVMAILGSLAESAALEGATERLIREAMKHAFRRTARRMRRDLEWDPAIARDSAIARTLAENVQGTTDARIRKVIEDGLAEGLSATDIADNIRRDSAFNASRSLAIARAETTKSVNAGAVASMRKAEEKFGIEVRKQWLSAGDGKVRDDHRYLDGQVVPTDEPFRTQGGKTAMQPGGFGDPSLDANCRCTVVPIVVGE